MPRTNDSKNAEKFNHAYFTSSIDAEWVISRLSQIYDLSGKTILEPCVGAGAFVAASKGRGIRWVTNELFPEHGRGFKPDFQEDFLATDLSKFGRPDLIITNPPFGQYSALAKSFVMQSLEVSDIVAMILPRGLRKPTWFDRSVPRDIKIVLDEDLPSSSFLLPDGTYKEVGCYFLVLERKPGYDRGQILPTSPDGFRFEKGEHDWPSWSTHATCMWGASSGKILSREQRGKRCWRITGFFQFTPEQRRLIPDDLLRKDVLNKATSVRGTSNGEIFALFNPILRASS